MLSDDIAPGLGLSRSTGLAGECLLDGGAQAYDVGSQGAVGEFAVDAQGGYVLHGECRHEARRARAYKLFISKIMEVDPNEALLAFQDMMKKKITMPAMYMRERGSEIGSAFEKFEAVAQRTGIYTARDYVDILQHLVNDWHIADLRGLSSAGEKAQDYLCSLPERYRKIVERYSQKIDDTPYTFS